MADPPGRYAGSVGDRSGAAAGPITWVTVPPLTSVTGPRAGPNSWVACPVCCASHAVNACCHGCTDRSVMQVRQSDSEVTVCCTTHTSYALKMPKAIDARYVFV
jgi:hypothetical protein